MSEEDIQFLLWAADQLVGGSPALGIKEDQTYAIKALCTCEECRLLGDGPVSSSIVGAVRGYTKSRIAYKEAQQNRVLH